jgi:CIC family chloride channel protein
LIRRGVDIRAGKEVNVLKSIPVKDVLNPDVETLPENLSMEKLFGRISKSNHNSFPVLNEKSELTGILSFIDYSNAVFDENLKYLVVVKELATQNVVTISLDGNLYDALEKITLKDYSILPVVFPDNPKQMAGIITRRDIIGAYNKALIKKSFLNE